MTVRIRMNTAVGVLMSVLMSSHSFLSLPFSAVCTNTSRCRRRRCQRMVTTTKTPTNLRNHSITSLNHAILMRMMMVCILWMTMLHKNPPLFSNNYDGSSSGVNSISSTRRSVLVVEAFGGSTRAAVLLPVSSSSSSCYRRRSSSRRDASQKNLLVKSNMILLTTTILQKSCIHNCRRRGNTLPQQKMSNDDDNSISSSSEDDQDEQMMKSNQDNKFQRRHNSNNSNNNNNNNNSNNKRSKKGMKSNSHNNIYNASSTSSSSRSTTKRSYQHTNNKPNLQQRKPYSSSSTTNSTTSKNNYYNTTSSNRKGKGTSTSPIIIKDMKNRITQLERLVAAQTVELHKLRQECKDLTEAATAFTQVVDLLRQAGLTASPKANTKTTSDNISSSTSDSSNDGKVSASSNALQQQRKQSRDTTRPTALVGPRGPEYEYFDDSEIFGKAPTSVIDAADAAGAAILAAMLAGKLRMLVDVRDAELNTNPDTLVQFIELAILPVAAGLEGLSSSSKDDDDDDDEDNNNNNTNSQQQQQQQQQEKQPHVHHHHRVKVVFPTVSKLLEYRKSMCLSAPDVVALSVLGFGSVEEKDNLVVFIAPSPDNEEGLQNMMDILNPKNPVDKLRQPVVVLNHHMLPLPTYYSQNFEVVYHLRLLSVQYMATTGSSTAAAASGGRDELPPRDYVERLLEAQRRGTIVTVTAEEQVEDDNDNNKANITSINDDDITIIPSKLEEGGISLNEDEQIEEKDEALEAAMTHAYGTGIHQGLTRAMVIRAYPRPWHVFVDTSPDADIDFEVAATFDEEPSTDEVNFAIIECLEGSEREDELVAQQMQEALETGQLNKVSETLLYLTGSEDDDDDDDDDDEDDDDFSLFGADST